MLAHTYSCLGLGGVSRRRQVYTVERQITGCPAMVAMGVPGARSVRTPS